MFLLVGQLSFELRDHFLKFWIHVYLRDRLRVGVEREVTGDNWVKVGFRLNEIIIRYDVELVRN